MPTTYDSPWQEALEVYFEPFVAYFCPASQAEIDWSRGYVPLDKELQQIAPQSEAGARTVDKLMKVWRRDGQEEWVLVHVEVQSQHDPDFLVCIARFEEARKVPYITSIERLGIKKGERIGEKRGEERGKRQCLLQGIEIALRIKFGQRGEPLGGRTPSPQRFRRTQPDPRTYPGREDPGRSASDGIANPLHEGRTRQCLVRSSWFAPSTTPPGIAQRTKHDFATYSLTPDT